MTPQDFCYWLQGYFEVSDSYKLSEEQAKVIKEHLDKVFKKEFKKESESTKTYPWSGDSVLIGGPEKKYAESGEEYIRRFMSEATYYAL